MEIPRIRHRYVDVDGVRVFYRETVPVPRPGRPALPLLLLHGFPSASHQYRRLLAALGGRYRMIAPDYPGFGHTTAPPGFRYSFDALAEVTDGFLRAIGLHRFAMYVFDYGGPVGFRLAESDPRRVAGLIVQNANAYHEGLSPAAQRFIHHTSAAEIRDQLVAAATRSQYETGTADPELIDPDGWTLDQHHLDRPGRAEAQVALALDYRGNVARYPAWQEWLRRNRPPALIAWGRGDPFFTEAGARAYLRDLPDAELHLFDTGHFALEEKLSEVTPLVAGFLDRVAPLRIAVIGATGRIGGTVAALAAERGHRVSRLSRREVDVTDPASVAAAVAGHDAVVVAVKGPDKLVPRAAEALLSSRGLPAAGVPRLVFVGGGGSLRAPDGQRFVDRPDFPAPVRQGSLDQAEALDRFRAADTTLEWSYASPPPSQLVDGPATGGYRTAASETPLLDGEGQSRISVPDFGHAIVDALERREFVRQRFTAAY